MNLELHVELWCILSTRRADLRNAGNHHNIQNITKIDPKKVLTYEWYNCSQKFSASTLVLLNPFLSPLMIKRAKITLNKRHPTLINTGSIIFTKWGRHLIKPNIRQLWNICCSEQNRLDRLNKIIVCGTKTVKVIERPTWDSSYRDRLEIHRWVIREFATAFRVSQTRGALTPDDCSSNFARKPAVAARATDTDRTTSDKKNKSFAIRKSGRFACVIFRLF